MGTVLNYGLRFPRRMTVSHLLRQSESVLSKNGLCRHCSWLLKNKTPARKKNEDNNDGTEKQNKIENMLSLDNLYEFLATKSRQTRITTETTEKLLQTGTKKNETEIFDGAKGKPTKGNNKLIKGHGKDLKTQSVHNTKSQRNISADFVNVAPLLGKTDPSVSGITSKLKKSKTDQKQVSKTSLTSKGLFELGNNVTNNTVRKVNNSQNSANQNLFEGHDYKIHSSSKSGPGKSKQMRQPLINNGVSVGKHQTKMGPLKPLSPTEDSSDVINSYKSKEKLINIQDQWLNKWFAGSDLKSGIRQNFLKATNPAVKVTDSDRNTTQHMPHTSWLGKLRSFKGKIQPRLSKSEGQEKLKAFESDHWSEELSRVFTAAPKIHLERNINTPSINVVKKLFDFKITNRRNRGCKTDVSVNTDNFGLVDRTNRQLAGQIDISENPAPCQPADLEMNMFKQADSGETLIPLGVQHPCDRHTISETVNTNLSSESIVPVKNVSDFPKISWTSGKNMISNPADISLNVSTDLQDIPTVLGASKENGIPKLREVSTALSDDGSELISTELKEKKKENKTSNRRAKLHSQIFTSYLEVSIFAGMFSKALHDFKWMRHTQSQSESSVTLSMYNILLKGVASTNAPLDIMLDLFKRMANDRLQPNMESYAYCLVRIGKKKASTEKYGSVLLDQMKAEGLEISDIFIECALTGKEANSIKQVVRTLLPDVTLKPRHAVQAHTMTLTKRLNTPAQIDPEDISTSVKLDTLLEQVEIQANREIDGVVTIPSIWEDSTSDAVKRNELFKRWQTTLEGLWENEMRKAKEKAWYTKKFNLYPYLCVLQENEYIDILMDKAIELSGLNKYYSPTVNSVQRDLGERVYARYRQYYNLNGRSTKALAQCYKEYLARTIKSTQHNQNYRHIWQELASQITPYSPTKMDPYPWNLHVTTQIGEFLLKILLENLTIQVPMNKDRQEQKCLFVILRNRGFKNMKEIQPHPMLGEYKIRETIKTVDKVPMLCPPLPYISSSFGGLVTDTASLLRFKSKEGAEWFHKKNPIAVFDAINILSNSAWVMNKPVLDVVLHLFKNGGAPEISIPLHPDTLVPPDKNSSSAEKKKFKKEFQEATSLWYSEMYKYAIANMFRDETFWLPYNLDFRGRNYPMSILNHQGNDVIRGILKFAESKPLGEEGLKWLKIHLVNLTELKKRNSLSDRLAYVDEIMEDIVDSADNPLNGRRWWMKFENAIQLLAACKELMAALRSPNPKTFYSNFPLHQDGSCNGLQHYAALGLDVDGAKYVNLHPSETPSDVYANVAELIKKQIDVELAEDSENEIATLAKRYLERKIIKQSVMTQVYGVTRFGVFLQISKQLKGTDCPEDKQTEVIEYLTNKTFQSLTVIFKAGKEIQSWFDACASSIAQSKMTVDWVTPIGFPVQQGYFNPEDSLGNRIINKQKQRNGFSPNFIHSLDASHMMLTALYCHREGIRFDSIHDSFWTHPCDMNKMNKVTREQFVALHKEPILDDLSKFFQDYYGEILKGQKDYPQIMQLFRKVPEKGDFKLDLVKESTYFFS